MKHCTQSLLQLLNFLEKLWWQAWSMCTSIQPKRIGHFSLKIWLLNSCNIANALNSTPQSENWKNLYSFQEFSHTVFQQTLTKKGIDIDSQILQRSSCAHTLEETCQWIWYCTPSLTNFLFWRNYFSCFEEWEQKKLTKENIKYLARWNQEEKSCVTVCDSIGKFC